MKCPLLMPRWIGFPELIEEAKVECIKEECAWWEKVGEACAMPLLALRSGTICETLDEIYRKMPQRKEGL